MLTFDLKIPADHPCLVGHFPNNPVVPAVVLIDEITQGFVKEFPEVNIHKITQFKFINPLKPDVLAHVNVVEKNQNTVLVNVLVGQQLYAKGEFYISKGEQR